MRRLPSLFLITFIMAHLASACGTPTQGPQAWIDVPIDNTTIPLAPLVVIAHASDSSGVASMEFYANDQLIAAVNSGGERLTSAEIEWNPPVPGTYLIGARAINNNGSAGAMATSLVTITGDLVAMPEEEETAPPDDPVATITKTATPSETPTPTSTPDIASVIAIMDANCREGPGTAYEVYANLLKGEEALIKGRLADNSWFLVALAGRSSNCWIAISTVNVRGNLDNIQVANAPPPPQQEPPPVDVQPPASVDTTPPAIFGAATDRNSMCASDTVRSNVLTVDDGGISYVYASWTLTDNNGVVVESGSVNYAPIPSQPGGYTAVFGSFSHSGTLTINGAVVDNAGNSAPFSHSIPITCS